MGRKEKSQRVAEISRRLATDKNFCKGWNAFYHLWRMQEAKEIAYGQRESPEPVGIILTAFCIWYGVTGLEPKSFYQKRAAFLMREKKGLYEQKQSSSRAA